MFKRGDTCYILESNYKVTQAKVVSRQGKFYTLQLIGSCGAIRLPEHRLFTSEDNARESMKVNTTKDDEMHKQDSKDRLPDIPDVFAGRRTNRSPYTT